MDSVARFGLPALLVLGGKCWYRGLATLLTGNSGRGLPGRLGGSSSNMESVGAPGDKHAHTTVSSHYDACCVHAHMCIYPHAEHVAKLLYTS